MPPLGKGVAPAVDAFAALHEVVQGTLDYLRLREVERTKRAQIDARCVLETQRIRSAEGILRDYFRQVFAERANSFDELLERLDRATDAGDGARASQTLDAIVAIAKHSPLADLGDLEQLRAALSNPDHVWEL
jgi:hypothetical protein